MTEYRISVRIIQQIPRNLIAKIIRHIKTVVLLFQLIPADGNCRICIPVIAHPLHINAIRYIRMNLITAISHYSAVFICYRYITGRICILHSLLLHNPQQLPVPGFPDLLLVESRSVKDTIHLVFQSLHLTVNIRPVFLRIRAVGRLHRKFIHPLQHVMHFVERTFCRLDIAYPFRNIIHRLMQAAHLPAHFLGDRQPRRIIRCPVDPISRRKFFCCLRVSPTTYV